MPDCQYVPLYTTRMVAYVLTLVFSAITVGAAFHAKHESGVTKGAAQEAVSNLTPGVKVVIDTTDVYTAGEVEGIAQLGTALLALGCIGLLIRDTRKRYAVPNAPHVLQSPWSSRTLILQVLCFVIAASFTFATAVVTTVFVASRQAKVTSILPNGTFMPESLVAAFATRVGISPVYKNQDYLVFLAVAPWGGFLFSFIALIVTFMAWRRHCHHSAARQRTYSFDSTGKDSTEKY